MGRPDRPPPEKKSWLRGWCASVMDALERRPEPDHTTHLTHLLLFFTLQLLLPFRIPILRLQTLSTLTPA